MSRKYDKRHGGAFDRGGADSYYGRPPIPHYYEAGSMTSKKVEEGAMSKEEIEAYLAGYEENEEAQCFKEYD